MGDSCRFLMQPHSRFRYFLILLSLATASCSTVWPEYERPPLDLPAAPPEPAKPHSIDRQWWKSFEDPALNALVAEALLHNSDLAKAAANGVNDLVLLSRDEARTMEPQLACVAAIHSPSSAPNETTPMAHTKLTINPKTNTNGIKTTVKAIITNKMGSTSKPNRPSAADGSQ